MRFNNIWSAEGMISGSMESLKEGNMWTKFTVCRGQTGEISGKKDELQIVPEVIPEQIIEKTKYSCDECTYADESETFVNLHKIRIHREIYRYPCEKCDYTSISVSGLKRHMSHMELAHADGDENISSDDDDVHLKEASELIDEIDTIKEEANFNVDWQNSPEVIEQRGNSIVDTQKQSVESTQILPCEKCDYSSVYPSNLKRHKNNVHDSENAKVFTCKKCDYSSKSTSGLKRHKSNVHDSESANVFSCEKCVYSCKLEFNLKRHKNTVHDSKSEKAFTCEKCVYSSNFKYDLKRHIEKKHLS